MPKYDEFGRPIYETAEEYNRAHRTGSNSRTYDSPEGKAYTRKPMKKTYDHRMAGQFANRTRKKKSKVMIIGIGIYFIAMIVFLSFNMVRNSYGNRYEDVPEDVDDIVINVGDEQGEFLGDDTIPLPEGFETFSYNGQMYSLPATMEEISEMGFTLEEAYEGDYMLPTDSEETLILNDEDGFFAAMIRVSNYTGEEISIGKSQVDYFYIENPAAHYAEEADVPDFVFGEGLTFESSYEEVEAYFGIPYYHYEDHSEEDSFYDGYEWAYYGEDENHFVSITFWNGVIADVGIEKRIVIDYEK